jgi:hypothetical protein
MDEFCCRGWDTVGSLKLFGGINTGRPGENDLAGRSTGMFPGIEKLTVTILLSGISDKQPDARGLKTQNRSPFCSFMQKLPPYAETVVIFGRKPCEYH